MHQPGQKTLIFMTKGDTPLMQTKQAFSAPLIDQRSNYVYYDVRYDQAQYNFIRGQDNDPTSWLYLLKNLAPKENAPFGVQMPMSTTTPANTARLDHGEGGLAIEDREGRRQPLLHDHRANLQSANEDLHADIRAAGRLPHRAQSGSVHRVGLVHF